MKEEDKILEAVLECAEGIYVIEEESKEVVYANPFLTNKKGAPKGQTCYSYFCGRSKRCPFCPKLCSQEEEIYRWEYFDGKSMQWINIKNTLVTIDGRSYRVGNVNLIQDVMELTRSSIGEIHTLKELLQSHEQRKYLLEWEAYHDRMTRLFNRSKFMDDNAGLFPACGPVGVLYFDINNLKQVNDTMGHEEGDKLIKKVAGILEGLICERIKAYRLGGDEFLVVILKAREEEVDSFRNLFYKELQSVNERSTLLVSVASGSSFGSPRLGVDSLLREADARMYQNKILQKTRSKVN